MCLYVVYAVETFKFNKHENHTTNQNKIKCLQDICNHEMDKC